MHNIHQSYNLPYAPEKLYTLVGDIERYPDFLPWIQQVKILRKQQDRCDARVMVGFKGLRQSYHCRVYWHENDNRIEVEYLSGPLADLFTEWKFHPREGSGCRVEFTMRFDMRQKSLAAIIDRLLIKAVQTMTDAFVHRAHYLFSKPA